MRDTALEGPFVDRALHRLDGDGGGVKLAVQDGRAGHRLVPLDKGVDGVLAAEPVGSHADALLQARDGHGALAAGVVLEARARRVAPCVASPLRGDDAVLVRAPEQLLQAKRGLLAPVAVDHKLRGRSRGDGRRGGAVELRVDHLGQMGHVRVQVGAGAVGRGEHAMLGQRAVARAVVGQAEVVAPADVDAEGHERVPGGFRERAARDVAALDGDCLAVVPAAR